MSSPGRATHHTRLLEAARRLLREREYGKITARDLVAASDTNLGSIGYHFGSKEALLNQAIGLALEEWAETIIRAAPDPHEGPGALMRSLATVLDDYDAIRPYYQAFIEALARSARSPDLRGQLAAHYERQRDRLTGWIAESLDSAIESDRVRQLASIMIATVDGMLIQTFIDADDAPGSHDLASAAGGAFAEARDR